MVKSVTGSNANMNIVDTEQHEELAIEVRYSCGEACATPGTVGTASTTPRGM